MDWLTREFAEEEKASGYVAGLADLDKANRMKERFYANKLLTKQ
jgi:hypothetical protein